MPALCKCIIGCLPLLALCISVDTLAADPPHDDSNEPQQQSSSFQDYDIPGRFWWLGYRQRF